MIRVCGLAALYLTAHALLAAQEAPAGFVFDTDVPYGSVSERQCLDILYPETTAVPLPAVVYIHGGGWFAGDKSGETAFGYLSRFSEAGYVAVSIAYRLSDEAPFPAAVEDCKLAIRWLRSNAAQFGIDPARIGAIGVSAGGHLTAMLALTRPEDGFDVGGQGTDASSAIQAAVPVAAPFDLQSPLAAQLAHEDDPVVLRFIGGPLAEHADATRRASPVNYARPGSLSMLIVHGTADRRVNLSQAESMMDALRNAGAPYEHLFIEGGKHDTRLVFPPAVFDRVLWYFARHLDHTEAYWQYRAIHEQPGFETRTPVPNATAK